MKKTVQMHIGGGQYHIDDDAYNLLQQYLEALKIHFEKDGEAGKEIIADIEQRIAELLKNIITESKQVVTSKDIDEIIKTLGTIEDFNYAEDGKEDSSPYDRRANRRFYRDCESNYLGGVAAGLGAYFNIDPVWIRLAFIALLFLKGAGLLVYAVLWLVVPKAVTTAQKLEMKGKPVTINTIEESISEEYQKVKSNINSWSQSQKTRNTLQDIVKAFATLVVAVFKFFLYAIGIIFLITGSLFLAALVVLFVGQIEPFQPYDFLSGWIVPDLSGWISNPTNFRLLAISLFALVLIPLVSLIYAGIKILFHIKTKSVVLRATALTGWILALILFLTVLFSEISNFSVEAMGSDSKSIASQQNSTLYIDVNDNLSKEHTITYSIFDYDILHDKKRDAVYGQASLTFLPVTDQQEITYSVKRYLRNVSMNNAHEYLDEIRYHAKINDSVLVLDQYFEMDEKDFWRFGKVEVEVKVPVNACVNFHPNVCSLFYSQDRERYCVDSLLAGKKCIMTRDGLTAAGEIKNSR
jgi:phage shock protein PspC (stress-responsive transcriptional regulator)